MGLQISKVKAAELFQEHSQYIYRVALFLTRSKELAEDIAQETWIKIYNKYDTYDTSKPIQPWLYKITLNITRNTLRKQQWLSFWSEPPETAALELVENTVLKNEAQHELWRKIDSLSQKSREVVVLHFYSGMTLVQVAAVLGIPLGTCKSRLNTALNTLRKQLDLSKGGVIDEAI